MHTYSAFFQTLHDETGPTGYLGRGTHCSILSAVVFHDSAGHLLPKGQCTNFAVIWDEDHDTRVIEPIEEIYRRGLLSSFVMFGERQGAFTAVRLNKLVPTDDFPFDEGIYQEGIGALGLSERGAACLKRANVHFTVDLVRKKEADLLRESNFDRKSIAEIKELLSKRGLQLGMGVPWSYYQTTEIEYEQARLAFLKEEIKEVCQSLSDPWSSEVVALENPKNSIINDEIEKVSLYLRNLEMLWHLGMQRRKVAAVAGNALGRIPETSEVPKRLMARAARRTT